MTAQASEYTEVLAGMAENLRNPVLIEDEEHKIVYVNRIMQETFGNLVGYHWNILFLTDARESFEAEENPFESSGGPREVVIADVTYKVLTTPVTGEDGKPYNVVLMEDISEIKGLQNRLRSGLDEIRRDTKIAQQIQRSAVPADGDYWGAIRLHAQYLPAGDLSGDFFDIVRVSEDKTLLYIADVSGHGIQASLLTMFIRENVRGSVHPEDTRLDALLGRFLKTFGALDVPAMFYMSILLCMYDRARGELSIANAGHNCFPLVIRGSGRVEEITVRGMPISKISDPDSYEEEIIVVHKGDRILLYTDGIVEEYSKTKKKSFGTDGVRRIAEECYRLPGDALARRILEESDKYTLISAKDDRTLLAAEIL
jgi:sigma-B regulation protein RsbU (phosphoserine phosphatase)